MATSTLITDYLGYGTAADRPATPSLPTGGIGLYYATDTNTLSAYVNGTWYTISIGAVNSMTDGDILSNISGSSGPAAANTLTAILDHVFSSTQGSVLYRGASAWTALAPGTSGDVLTTRGSGADPEWSAGGGGGGGGNWTLVSSQTTTSGSSLAWTGLSANDAYRLVFHGFTLNSSSGNAGVQVGYGATPTYVTTGYSGGYFLASNSGTAEGNPSNTTSFSLIPTGMTGKIDIFGCDSSSANYLFDLQGTFGPGTDCLIGVGKVTNAGNQVTAITILPDGGTFTGKVSLYAIND